MLEVDWISSDLQRFTVRTHDQSQHILRGDSVWAELSPFSTLPRWMNSVACSLLSDLSIMVEKLRQEDLDILAGLPKLLSLDLEVVQVEGEAIGRRLKINGPGRSTPFPFLGNFKFATRAAGLVFRSGAMQKLQNLYLCFDLAETKDIYGDFDFGLENLTSVKIVKIEMDCRCAMLSEVKAAEVALYDSTELNPNCPTPYLKRYFEREMLSDEEEEIPEEQRAKKKEDTQLSTVGPFGGNGGRSRDIRVAPHRLKNISIFSGDIVDSLAFSYTDHEGQQRSAGPWGSHHNAVESKINLGPSDYLIKVSGTVGSHFGLDNLITSLSFVTNAASYGPFGKGGGHPFVFKVQRNSSIVGFFGRAGGYLDAIGFYVRPL